MSEACITCTLEHLGAAQVELDLGADDPLSVFRALHYLRLAQRELMLAAADNESLGELIPGLYQLRGMIREDTKATWSGLRIAEIMVALYAE